MDAGFYVLMGGVPGAVIAYLAYRQGRKRDKVTEQSGIATETRAGTAQIIEGLNDLIDALQLDNRQFRDDIKYLTLRLDAIAKERDDLRREVARLRRKYGESNGEDE